MCAHQHKVDGSNLHMCDIYFGSTAGVFSQLEKDFFDDECRCLIWIPCWGGLLVIGMKPMMMAFD